VPDACCRQDYGAASSARSPRPTRPCSAPPRWLRARNTLTELSLDSAEGYYRTVNRLQHARRRGLLSKPLRIAVDGHDPAARFATLMAECDPEDSLLQAQYADLHTYLPGDILNKVDRTSMAVSLEVRPPILGHEMVEWGMALPSHLKLHGGVGKKVLRQAMAPHLPPEVVDGGRGGVNAVGLTRVGGGCVVRPVIRAGGRRGAGGPVFWCGGDGRALEF
jgi:hypothetical protein